jgi:hypothetical protein
MAATYSYVNILAKVSRIIGLLGATYTSYPGAALRKSVPPILVCCLKAEHIGH